MGTNPVKAAMAVHRCSEVDIENSSVRDVFCFLLIVSWWSLRFWGKLGEGEKARKRGWCVATMMTLSVVPVIFLSSVSLDELKSVWQNNEEYRSQTGNPSEAEHVGGVGDVDLDTLLDKDMSWSEAGDTERMTEERRMAMCLLILAASHEIHISKKGYVDLLRSLADETQSWRSK